MNDLHDSTDHKVASKAHLEGETHKHLLCLFGCVAMARMLVICETRIVFGMGGATTSLL